MGDLDSIMMHYEEQIAALTAERDEAIARGDKHADALATMVQDVDRREADPTLRVLSEVDDERKRQDARWGEQSHEPRVWLAILGEEFGEACKGANDACHEGAPWDDYRHELIQVAAVAVAAVESLDRRARSMTCGTCRDYDHASTTGCYCKRFPVCLFHSDPRNDPGCESGRDASAMPIWRRR